MRRIETPAWAHLRQSGMTVSDVARRCTYSEETVRRALRGGGHLGPMAADRIAKAIGCDATLFIHTGRRCRPGRRSGARTSAVPASGGRTRQ